MSKKTWYELSVVVMIVVRDRDRFLLGRRFNTGFKDGQYALPGGKHDGRETLRETVAREAREELGIDASLDAIELRSTIHYMAREVDQELVYTVFEIKDYKGELYNAEPHRCDDLQFFAPDQFPENTTDMTLECIRNTLEGITYSEFGWG